MQLLTWPQVWPHLYVIALQESRLHCIATQKARLQLAERAGHLPNSQSVCISLPCCTLFICCAPLLMLLLWSCTMTAQPGTLQKRPDIWRPLRLFSLQWTLSRQLDGWTPADAVGLFDGLQRLLKACRDTFQRGLAEYQADMFHAYRHAISRCRWPFNKQSSPESFKHCTPSRSSQLGGSLVLHWTLPSCASASHDSHCHLMLS